MAGLERATGCRVPWGEMIGGAVSRHCPRCGSEVVDLRAMTRRDLRALFTRAACTPGVRLHLRPDGRVGTGDCSRASAPGGVRALCVAALGIALGGSLGAVAAVGIAGPERALADALAIVDARVEAGVEARRPALAASAPSVVAPSVAMSAPFVARVAPRAEVRVRSVSRARRHHARGPAGAISPAELASSVRPRGEDTWEVDRAFIDRLMDNQSSLMRASRVIPHEVGGRVVGVRMYGIRPGSLLDALGLQNGDTLMAVNGLDMTSPDHALEAYTQLRQRDMFAVLLERRGARRLHVYRIID